MSDEAISYAAAKGDYPDAVKDVENRIRSARAASSNDAFETFDWYVCRGTAMTLPKKTNTIRIYARKGRLARCSRLYDTAGNVVHGLWSF